MVINFTSNYKYNIPNSFPGITIVIKIFKETVCMIEHLVMTVSSIAFLDLKSLTLQTGDDRVSLIQIIFIIF